MQNLRKLLENAKGYVYGDAEVSDAKRIINEYPELEKIWNNLDHKCSCHPRINNDFDIFNKEVKEKGNVYVCVSIVKSSKANISDLINGTDIDIRLFEMGTVPVIRITVVSSI